MKKFSFYVVAATISFFVSACTSKPFLPQNPKDKEEKTDEEGNRWIYNSHGGYWTVYPFLNGSSGVSSTNGISGTGGSYRYYPGTNSFTNDAGTKIDPPANLKSSVKPNSSGTSVNKPKASPSRSGKAFSSGIRPKSFGA